MNWAPGTFFVVLNAAHERLPEIGTAAFAVYAYFCKLADRDGKCFPAVLTIAKKCGITERSARRAIASLAAAEMIRVVGTKTDRGATRSNTYSLVDFTTQEGGGQKGQGLALVSGGGGQKRQGAPGAFVRDEGDKNDPLTKEPIEQNPSEQSKSPKLRFNDDDRAIAVEILEGVRQVVPNSKQPNLDTWANEIRLMRERDGPDRTPEGIRQLFAWANANPFWRTNILSPEKLREKWDQLQAKRNQGATNGNGRHQRQRDMRGQVHDPSRPIVASDF